MTSTPLTKKDYKSDQDVRWCPGCGDYGVLNAVQTAFAKLQKERHNTVMISGIGCSSRFPYYMDTYGFHTIHGRALAIATGVKLANPDLDVWVVTGDGDGLSIGGNHLIHALRRNVGLKVLLFNNRIYGLTKGQYSPTSERGKTTKSTPFGSTEEPFAPISLALGAGASFVGRSVDIFVDHLITMIERMDECDGTALLEIYQNCNIYNDEAFSSFTDKAVRAERIIRLEHGKPVVFGADGQRKGLRLDAQLRPEILDLEQGGASESDCLVWDEASPNPGIALALSELSETEMPVPIGLFRNVPREAFEAGVLNQIANAEERKTESLEQLLHAGETWVVDQPGWRE